MSDEKRTKFVPIAAFFGVVVGLGLGIVIGHYGISDEYCDTRGFVEPSQQIDMGMKILSQALRTSFRFATDNTLRL